MNWGGKSLRFDFCVKLAHALRQFVYGVVVPQIDNFHESWPIVAMNKSKQHVQVLLFNVYSFLSFQLSPREFKTFVYDICEDLTAFLEREREKY